MLQTIKLKTRYRRIASMYFFHEYYSNQICRDFTVRPDLETQMKMQSFGILSNTDSNGFILAMDMSKNFNHEIFSGVLELRFEFSNINPYFINFTNIPFEVDQYFVFEPASNLKSGFLHPERYVTGACSTEGVESGLKGHLTLKLNIDDEWFGKELDVEKEWSPYEYLVYFDKRECYWDYLISVKQGAPDSVGLFSVIPKNKVSEKYEFEVPELIVEGSRKGYLKISSKVPIPLEEKPKLLFELRRNGKRGVSVPYTRILPNANPRNLKFCKLKNQFITEIFVKL